MSDVLFELQVVDAIVTGLSALTLARHGIAEPVNVFGRALDATDPNLSIGVFLRTWGPTDTPNIGFNEPAIGRYRFGIQTLVKDAEREPGEIASNFLTKTVRQALYRDSDLQVALGAIREGDFPPYERSLKWGIEQIEYAGAQVSNGFAFVTQIEFYLDTEVA